MTNVEQLTELCRRQAHRIDELEATLQMLMVAADWHISSVGEVIDKAREHLDADQDQDPITDCPGQRQARRLA